MIVVPALGDHQHYRSEDDYDDVVLVSEDDADHSE
jgi:hypothetical protein